MDKFFNSLLPQELNKGFNRIRKFFVLDAIVFFRIESFYFRRRRKRINPGEVTMGTLHQIGGGQFKRITIDYYSSFNRATDKAIGKFVFLIGYRHVIEYKHQGDRKFPWPEFHAWQVIV